MIDIAAVMRLLGHGNEHPTAARRHRSTLATKHVFDRGAVWNWKEQPGSRSSVAGLIFADVPVRVDGEPDSITASPGEAAFLHPYRQVTLEAAEAGSAVCIWLPWDSLMEVEDGVQTPGRVMAATPLTSGLRAFLTSLLTQPSEPTLYTDYLVERVVVEMAFGALLESVPKNVAGARESRMIDRARSLMLMKRAEPDFGIAELARELHASTRHVQRMFAAEKSAPADELRGMRVDLANELLGNPAYDPLSIAEIAEHAGFKTAAALRRAFAARDLPLPSRTRQGRMLSA
ncbi:helix-turn-helix domain-containing protein [Microbacterium sp. NPDC058342]|uniref:AraC family transcriptional regulator n=1 Tax=Microbacterium sp. NPDC058342 TaxID=3346454 RepID=UPI00364D0358